MNHQNGQPKMTTLGEALSKATKKLEPAIPDTSQKLPIAANHYGDDAVLGVECAMPYITGGSYATA